MDSDRDGGPGAKAPPPGWPRYAAMGAELVAAVVGLTLVGYWVDRSWGTAPKGVAIGAGLGLVGGFYNFFRQAWLLVKEQQRPTHGTGNARRDDERSERQ